MTGAGTHWHTLTVDETRGTLDLPIAAEGQDASLTSAEAAERAEIYGRNELDEIVADPWYVVLGKQLTSSMVIFLLITVVEAVRLGRVTFSSIRKATFFLLTNGLALMIAVIVNTFTDLPLIFMPVVLLFMNVITNGIQDIALSFEKGEGDELEQKPRPSSEGVLDTRMWIRTVVTGAWMGIGTLLVYRWAHESGLPLEEARTLALITMVMFNFFQVFSARALRRCILTMNPLGNKLLAISALIAIFLQWGVTAWPAAADLLGLTALSWDQWLMCTGIGVTVLVIVEIEKLIWPLAAARFRRVRAQRRVRR